MTTKITNSKKPDLSVMTLFKENQNKYKTPLKTRVFDGEVSGVVYLGHIPHGFFETEMKAYFNQFGTVSRIKLSRSKKTGESKGYAFIEFKSETVAKVVAETMNNYLMFGKLMKCTFCESRNLHADTFKGCTRKFKHLSREIAIKNHNKIRLGINKKKIQKTKVKNEKLKNLLKKYGIDYDLTDVIEDTKKVVVSKKRKLSESNENVKSSKIIKIENNSPVKKITKEKVTLKTKKTPVKVNKLSEKKENTPAKKTPTKNNKSPVKNVTPKAIESPLKLNKSPAKVNSPLKKSPIKSNKTPTKKTNSIESPKPKTPSSVENKKSPKQRKSLGPSTKKVSPTKPAKIIELSPPRELAPPPKVFTPRTSMRLRKTHDNDLEIVSEEVSVKRKRGNEDTSEVLTPAKRMTRKSMRKP